MKRIVTFLWLLAIAALAHAQNAVSWVASTGNDSNTCVRTSPCRTFAVAVDKTIFNGTVRAVDASDYGTLTISKSLIIDGGDSGAFIGGIGGDALTITPGPADNVTIRNLAIYVGTAPFNGIVMYLASTATVNIENVSIATVINSYGIIVNSNGSDNGSETLVNLRNVNINGRGSGVSMYVGQLTADRLSANTKVNALLLAGKWLSATIRDSVFHAPNGSALNISSDINSQNPKSLMIEHCELGHSGGGLSVYQAAQAPPLTVRLSNTLFSNNMVGIVQDGGTVISYRNNVFAGNLSDGNPPLSASLK